MKHWTMLIACWMLCSCALHQVKEQDYGYHDYAADKLQWEDSNRAVMAADTALQR